MNENSLFAFAVTAVLIELTPGPNMGYLAVVAASAGRRAGLAATAGVAVGLLSAGIASSLGLAAIVATSGLVYELLGWSGAFYLLWLAWEGWPDAPGGFEKPVDTSSDKGFFLKGFVNNLLNPKASIFYLSVLAIRLPANAVCRRIVGLGSLPGTASARSTGEIAASQPSSADRPVASSFPAILIVPLVSENARVLTWGIPAPFRGNHLLRPTSLVGC